jgi:hypothetical protein
MVTCVVAFVKIILLIIIIKMWRQDDGYYVD